MIVKDSLWYELNRLCEAPASEVLHRLPSQGEQESAANWLAYSILACAGRCRLYGVQQGLVRLPPWLEIVERHLRVRVVALDRWIRRLRAPAPLDQDRILDLWEFLLNQEALDLALDQRWSEIDRRRDELQQLCQNQAIRCPEPVLASWAIGLVPEHGDIMERWWWRGEAKETETAQTPAQGPAFVRSCGSDDPGHDPTRSGGM